MTRSPRPPRVMIDTNLMLPTLVFTQGVKEEELRGTLEKLAEEETT